MRDAKPASSPLVHATLPLPSMMASDPAIDFWIPWMTTAPQLCQALAPALAHAPDLLQKRVHREAILALWMSRPSVFNADAPEVENVTEAWEAAVHFMNSEVQDENATDRQLFYAKLNDRWVPVWPLAWHALRILFSIPRGKKASQVNWEQTLRNPSGKPGKAKRIILAYTIASLIQAAMRQLLPLPPTALPRWVFRFSLFSATMPP